MRRTLVAIAGLMALLTPSSLPEAGAAPVGANVVVSDPAGDVARGPNRRLTAEEWATIRSAIDIRRVAVGTTDRKIRIITRVTEFHRPPKGWIEITYNMWIGGRKRQMTVIPYGDHDCNQFSASSDADKGSSCDVSAETDTITLTLRRSSLPGGGRLIIAADSLAIVKGDGEKAIYGTDRAQTLTVKLP